MHDASPAVQRETCDGRHSLTVHFYDVGEALSALVALPDGRHVLVDAGDRGRRTGCGDLCETEHEHLIARLVADLRGAPIDLLWVTHQHADHVGGVPGVLDSIPVRIYVDNGREPNKPEVRSAHTAADRHGAARRIVDPEHTEVPIPDSPDLKLTTVLPSAWPPSCAHDPNECSIGLRVDFCASSVLFTGDAEHEEEALLNPGGPVTLLQVAHHGSETSTTPAFLARVRPKYAVISAGKPGEGSNRTYCHPRRIVVQRLTRILGGPTTRSIEAFDGERCDRATPSDWISTPASDALWATPRDGDIVLTTRGDGSFRRELP